MLSETAAEDGELVESPGAVSLESMVEGANLPALLMVIHQVTGDDRWLAEPFLPTRSRGLDDHDSGGFSEEVQAEIRDAGIAALRALDAGLDPAIPQPSAHQLVRMLAACVGDVVSEESGDLIAEEFEYRAASATELPPVGPPVEGAPTAIILGAGISGIIAAYYFRRAGIEYTIIDSHDGAGGNWRDNRYPGAGVDTPSHLYSFSFAPRDWSYHFELRNELVRYFDETLDSLGAAHNARFGVKVTQARYDEDLRRWTVTGEDRTGDPVVLSADILISAVGILNRPKMPDLPGMDEFNGLTFHSAEWPDDADLRGKRVAIVGTGASAMQIVPAIAESVEHLTVFQRSPAWVAPFDKFRVPLQPAARELLRRYPLYRTWYWLKLFHQFGDKVLDSIRRDPDWPFPERSVNARNDGHREFFTEYIKACLGDRDDLLGKVLPTYPPYGKRILLDNGWYSALCAPNVDLVDEAVTSVSARGVRSTSGVEYECDVLIWATGFQASKFVSSYDVVGREGTSLRTFWDDDDARAFLGVAVPGFPNLFLLGGPNSFPGSGSFMYFMELQMRYITRIIAETEKAGKHTVEVREDRFVAYNELVDEASQTTVWSHPGMETFFRNARGRLVFVSPFKNVEFWAHARESNLTDYMAD